MSIIALVKRKAVILRGTKELQTDQDPTWRFERNIIFEYVSQLKKRRRYL